MRVFLGSWVTTGTPVGCRNSATGCDLLCCPRNRLSSPADLNAFNDRITRLERVQIGAHARSILWRMRTSAMVTEFSAPTGERGLVLGQADTAVAVGDRGQVLLQAHAQPVEPLPDRRFRRVTELLALWGFQNWVTTGELRQAQGCPGPSQAPTGGSLPPSLVGLAGAADRSTDLVPRPCASAELCAVTRSTVTDASSVPVAPCRQESAISPGQKSVNRPISGQY
jgi:hypothetical protein